jgi:hypothetical protein
MPANPRVEKTLCPRGVPNHNRKPLDLTGQRFDRLVVVELFAVINHGTMFVCRCDCGSDLLVRSYALRLGRTKSCGCLQRDQATQRLSRYRTQSNRTQNRTTQETP